MNWRLYKKILLLNVGDTMEHNNYSNIIFLSRYFSSTTRNIINVTKDFIYTDKDIIFWGQERLDSSVFSIFISNDISNTTRSISHHGYDISTDTRQLIYHTKNIDYSNRDLIFNTKDICPLPSLSALVTILVIFHVTF